MVVDRQSQQTPAGTVEIVLDSNGLVLSVDCADESRRLVSDVTEGEALHGHIHPDDYDFFLWSAQWVLNGQGRDQTIVLRWARAKGRWSKISATLKSDNGETLCVIFQPDEVEHARRAESSSPQIPRHQLRR